MGISSEVRVKSGVSSNDFVTILSMLSFVS